MMQQVSEPNIWTSVWLWLGRIADVIGLIVGLFGIPAIVIYLRRLRSRLAANRIIEATPLGLNSGFTGLVCCVSAPFPPSSDPARQPEAIAHLVKENEQPTKELLDTPVGSVLKAMEHHKQHLRHCWLVASDDSKPYLTALKEAARKYFPDVTLYPPAIVPDVYCRVDDVYEAVHMIFNTCEKDTGGKVSPKNIITDVTAGTKIMSIAVAMACLDAERNIQYIEQKERKLFYKIDISWAKISSRPRGE